MIPEPLYPIEQEALLDLREQWHLQGMRDRFWAGTVVDLNGARVRVPISLTWLEHHCAQYVDWRWSEEISMEPDDGVMTFGGRG